MNSRFRPMHQEEETMCLYRARLWESMIPLVELISETMHPALELTALRTGPTIETALRVVTSCEKETQNIPKIFQKSCKPRRPCPPGMTQAVARSLGLI